jgi:hypothetical protein
MDKVKVTADKNGNIVTVSESNPEYGYIRVEQNAMEVGANNWLRVVRRSTLVKGRVTDLLEAGFKNNQELPGKIVIMESLEPFNPENPDRDLKVAGKTGVICRFDDQPIYRQSVYTTNVDANDQLIAHTNAVEIREVQAAQNVAELLNTADAKL